MISNLTRYYFPLVATLHPIKTQKYESSQGLWQPCGPMLQNFKPGRHWWFCAQLEYEDSPNYAQYRNGLQAYFFLAVT